MPEPVLITLATGVSLEIRQSLLKLHTIITAYDPVSEYGIPIALRYDELKQLLSTLTTFHDEQEV